MRVECVAVIMGCLPTSQKRIGFLAIGSTRWVTESTLGLGSRWFRNWHALLGGLSWACAGLAGVLLCASPVEAQAAVGSPTEAHADDSRTVARRMAEDAANLYDRADYEGARDLFHRAYALFPAPALALWEARALDKLGRLVEAEERYVAVERYDLKPDDPQVVHAAVREARTEIRRLRKRIPTVTIELRGAAPKRNAVEVQIDGRRVNSALLGFPKPVDPGTRTIALWVNGKERQRVAVICREGDRRPVELHVGKARRNGFAVAAQNPAASRLPVRDSKVDSGRFGGTGGTQRALGWVGLGLGVVGIATGIATGVVATDQHQTLSERCDPDNVCPPRYHGLVDTFRVFEAVSTVGYVVGGLGAAAGFTLLLTAPDEPTAQRSGQIALRAGPTSAVLWTGF
ncbi:tol-pal system YbgF family protein [Myxococcota bacterium]